MKRQLAILFGWLFCAIALSYVLLALEAAWNFFSWRVKWSFEVCALIVLIALVLLGFGYLAQKIAGRVALVGTCILSVALAVIGFAAFPPEQRNGWQGPISPSPLWFRGGRLLVTLMPALFWLFAAIRNYFDSGQQKKKKPSSALATVFKKQD